MHYHDFLISTCLRMHSGNQQNSEYKIIELTRIPHSDKKKFNQPGESILEGLHRKVLAE